MADKRESGRRYLRENLGEEYLKNRDATTNSFNAPLRALSEAYAFGEVWSRPGLDRKIRSMLCLAMLTALNRPHEIRIHVNSALNNGCTVSEIQEVLLQTALYCGLPAAIDSHAVAEEVLRERGLITD